MARKGAKKRSPARARSPRAKSRTRARQDRDPAVELEQQLEACKRELAEALEQQTATSEVLQVISSSPASLEVVFQSMRRQAMQDFSSKVRFVQAQVPGSRAS